MKVKELIEELKKCDPESEVILQRDSEGNGYQPLHGADNQVIYNEDTGDVYNVLGDAEDHCMEEDEWAEVLQQPRCVVLFP